VAALKKEAVFLKAALPELKNYLFSKELYWSLAPILDLSQSADLTTLTPGNLLLCRARLKARPALPKEELLLGNLDEICHRWKAHWFQKIEKEIPARLTLWGNALTEAQEEGFTPASYRYQVRLRVILELLSAELPVTPLLYQKQIPALDQLLKAMTLPGSFVWEPEVMPAFPESDYWFLYRMTKTDIKKG